MEYVSRFTSILSQWGELTRLASVSDQHLQPQADPSSKLPEKTKSPAAVPYLSRKVFGPCRDMIHCPFAPGCVLSALTARPGWALTGPGPKNGQRMAPNPRKRCPTALGPALADLRGLSTEGTH